MVYRALMIDYAMKGYVVANMNYRLIQEAAPPACIEDVQAAVRWMRENAQELGIDANRIGTFGHSAGGHLSLMAGLTTDVACAVGGAPPTFSILLAAHLTLRGRMRRWTTRPSREFP